MPSRTPKRWSILIGGLCLTAAAAGVAQSCATARTASLADGPGRWETLPTGEQPTLRHENGYVRVGNRFYLIGGRGSKPVDIFDPATGQWSTGAAAPLEMHHFQAVEHGGRIYVLGALTGRYPTEPPIPDVYLYDPAADRWSKGPEIPADRRRGAAGAVVHDGLIYLVAGIQLGHTSGHVPWFDVLDPRTGQWRRLPDAPRARDHVQVAVVDDRLYVAGGRLSNTVPGQGFARTIAEVDVYDFRTGQWSTLPASSNIPTQRAGAATVAMDGRVVVLGGESGSQQAAHAEVEALDPRTGRWTALAPMNQGRHATQAVLDGGRLYIAAGSRTRGATEINSQEVFTPGR